MLRPKYIQRHLLQKSHIMCVCFLIVFNYVFHNIILINLVLFKGLKLNESKDNIADLWAAASFSNSNKELLCSLLLLFFLKSGTVNISVIILMYW